MSIAGLNINETDDDFFGTLQSNSNLANVFGVNEKREEDVNHLLKYKPIKPVPPSVNVDESGSPAMTWKVQVAMVVTAFKLINQENVPQGRVGLALLKSSQNGFKVIVYRSKSNVLATTTLKAGCKLTLKSSYLQFHDDSQEFWSVLLEPNDEKSFTEHLPPQFFSRMEKPPEILAIANDQPETISNDGDNTSKAKLLSRMAKMGQPLPKLAIQQPATDVSDSSDAELTVISPKPSIAPRKVSKQIVLAENALQTSRIVFDPQVQDNCYINMLLTENRTQNTELRINISKLETKIEKVLDKIDSIGSKDLAPNDGRDRDDEIVCLEEKILELRRDNRSLRQRLREVEAKNSDVDDGKGLKLKKAVFSNFEDVMEDLGIRMDDYENLEELTMQLLQKSRSVINKQRDDDKIMDKELADNEAKISKLQMENTKLREASKDYQDLQSKSEIVSKQCQELKHQLECVHLGYHDKFQSSIKQIMNNIYGEIVQGLDTIKEPLTWEAVLKICGSAIRKESLTVIEKNTN